MFEKTLKDIKELKIQGATNVAEESLKALSHVLKKSKSRSHEKLLIEVESARKKLFSARITEPLMRNIIRKVLYELKYNYDSDLEETKKNALLKARKTLKEFKEHKKTVSENGAKLIKNGSTIFTHCHSNSVVKSLILAKKQGKKFKVICTETRPRFQGRKTAKELVSAGINTTLIVDDAAMEYLSKADLVMIGADAITFKGDVINKIGTGLIGLAAHKLGKKVYSCTHSLKYDPNTKFQDEPIEHRDPKEIWKKPPKGLRIENPAFEKIPAKFVERIITEKGFLKPENVRKTVKKYYKWVNL